MAEVSRARGRDRLRRGWLTKAESRNAAALRTGTRAPPQSAAHDMSCVPTAPRRAPAPAAGLTPTARYVPGRPRALARRAHPPRNSLALRHRPQESGAVAGLGPTRLAG